MNDQRDLHRRFTLARLAGSVFDASRQIGVPAEKDAPPAALDALEGLLDEIEPTVQQMRARGADPEEIRRLLAGWVY